MSIVRQTPLRRYLISVSTLLILIVYFHYLPRPSLYGYTWEATDDEAADYNELICKSLPGAEDVLVFLKTGATEIRQKLPIHFNTTLRCIPNYALFSDLEDDIDGYHINDTLDGMSELTTAHYPEFKFHRQLKEYKKAGKNITALLDKAKDEGEDNGHKAWDLDKWKFLPLMEKALKTKPDAKWFVMIEADTYLMWSNLLAWLETLDPNKPYYMGAQNWGGGTEFAHGGSGIVMSNPALWKLVRYQQAHREFFEDLVGDDWAGDIALSKAFEKVGVKMNEAWPAIQGETPISIDYTDRHFCTPVVTYHHIGPEWIQKLWDYEQAWIYRQLGDDKPRRLLHRHIFDHFILPKIPAERQDWYNNSPDKVKDFSPATISNCREICRDNDRCVQYYFESGTCKTANDVRLGDVKKLSEKQDDEDERPELRSVEAQKFLRETTPTSGWLLERVLKQREKHGECEGEWPDLRLAGS